MVMQTMLQKHCILQTNELLRSTNCDNFSTGNTYVLQKLQICGTVRLKIENTSCFSGKNERTKVDSDFPLNNLIIVPTITKPSKKILVRLKFYLNICNKSSLSRHYFLQMRLHQEQLLKLLEEMQIT